MMIVAKPASLQPPNTSWSAIVLNSRSGHSSGKDNRDDKCTADTILWIVDTIRVAPEPLPSKPAWCNHFDFDDHGDCYDDDDGDDDDDDGDCHDGDGDDDDEQ